MQKSFDSAVWLAVLGVVSTFAYTYEVDSTAFWICLFVLWICRALGFWYGIVGVWLFCIARVLTRGRDFYEHYEEIIQEKRR